MRFERLTSSNHPAFPQAFALYEKSFPLHEQRTGEGQAGVMAHPEYHFTLLWEGEVFAGILLFWEDTDFLYVEHFAIAEPLRGQGIGAKALAELQTMGKPILLEIDPPTDKTAIRRQHFYQRQGFHPNPWQHVHPPYRPNFQGHPLLVMTWPAPWEREQYDRFFTYLTETVMADCPNETRKITSGED